MNYKKMLLTENPKALQYLHRAHGFDFEKPFFLGSIPGRFTYKMIADMIAANLGREYVAAVLVKPNRGNSFNRLHHASMDGHKFQMECRRGAAFHECNMDYFHTATYFEDIRKNYTERVYIIAQNPGYIVSPKNEIQIEANTRYRINTEAWRGGITRAGDGRGNHWISEITLLTTDGKRRGTTFQPWGSFYPSERRSDDINDYIDKSGYILRFRKMELHQRARALRTQHNAERLEKHDFSERMNKARADVATVKRYMIGLVENAEIEDNAAALRQCMWDFDSLISGLHRLENGKFSSVEAKNRSFDEHAQRAAKILNGGAKQ